MEHYLDIEEILFTQIKEHTTTVISIPHVIKGREVKIGDVLKLYHDGDDTEALRIEITAMEEMEPQKVCISFVLLEWMCRIETELDALLWEEEQWMKGLL